MNTQDINQNDIAESGARKQTRKALIRFHVWKDGPISRGRLAEVLRLNLPTISNCVAELTSSGDLSEEGYADSTGGRKPQLLDINPGKGAVVGLTFSSRGISSTWADLKGNTHNPKTYPFSPANGKPRALDTVFAAIAEQFRSVAEIPNAPPICQIGVGISGLVSSKKGISRSFPRFEEWADVPLRDLICERFLVPTTVDSHIAAITLAETVFGKHRGFKNALYVQLGPGLGLGIVINGQIYHGSKIGVGEFGHTTVVEDGPICYCGNYGCLEGLASDYALVQQAENAVREGVNTRIIDFSSEPGKVTTGAVFRAAQAGDRFAVNLIEKIGRLLGTSMANLMNLFGPEMIIFGGTMTDAGGDLLLNPIYNTMRTKALARMERDIEIKTSSFGREEALKGAVTLALYHHLAHGICAEGDLAQT